MGKIGFQIGIYVKFVECYVYLWIEIVLKQKLCLYMIIL